MDTALRQAQAPAPLREVIIVWPSTNVPPRLKETIEAIKRVHPGARVVMIKVRDSDVDRLLSYVDNPEGAPEIHRSFVEFLRYYGIRKLPALVIDGRLVAVGEDVEDTLRGLLHPPAIV